MNSEEFYMMTPGFMGTVVYSTKHKSKISDTQRQKLLDRIVNKKMQAFIINASMGNDVDNPGDFYSRARKEANEDIERELETDARYSLVIQVGNKESYNEILKIENKENFLSWDEPHIIEAFKTDYEINHG